MKKGSENESENLENVVDGFIHSMSRKELLDFSDLWMFWLSVFCILVSITYYVANFPLKEIVVLASIIFFIVACWVKFFK